MSNNFGDKNINVVVAIAQNLPFEIKAKVRNLIEQEEKVEYKEFENGPYASLEWAIPTAIIVYLVKPFFDSFLKEAGYDLYKSLKKIFRRKFSKNRKDLKFDPNWIEKLALLAREIRVLTIVSDLSHKKASTNNTQSKSFSIVAILEGGQKLKFMFNTALDNDEWKGCIKSILKVMKNHYRKFPNDKLSSELKEFNKNINPEFFAIYSLESNSWEFFDLNKIVDREYKAKKIEIINNSKKLVAENEILKAIELINREFFSSEIKEKNILFEARYNSCYKDNMYGLLTINEYESTMNKLRKDYLDFINILEKEILF